jgi:crotonobetainyl-CoA:carnitine CoA-transferase CaiB-like acyl-CoA transferase
VPEDRQELAGRLEEVFATKPRRHWLDYLRQADVPVGPVLTRDDYIQDPQVLHNEMRVEIDDPEVGPTFQMGVPISLRGTRGGVDARCSASTTTTFSATPRHQGRRAARRRRLRAGPLDGITVLDLGTIYAGPYAAMLLSDLGANVIKIEPLDGDPWRAFAIGFLGVNRGKRGLALDLKRGEGRELFYDLVQMDVVVDNVGPACSSA